MFFSFFNEIICTNKDIKLNARAKCHIVILEYNIMPGGGARGGNFFSGRGEGPRFPKCGASELIIASEKGVLCTENFKIWSEVQDCYFFLHSMGMYHAFFSRTMQ